MYKLAFGPKAFVVESDPIVVRHVLRENEFCYDKVLPNYMLHDSTHPMIIDVTVNMSLCKMPFTYVSMYELSLFSLYSYHLNYSSHIYTTVPEILFLFC